MIMILSYVIMVSNAHNAPAPPTYAMLPVMFNLDKTAIGKGENQNDKNLQNIWETLGDDGYDKWINVMNFDDSLLFFEQGQPDVTATVGYGQNVCKDSSEGELLSHTYAFFLDWTHSHIGAATLAFEVEEEKLCVMKTVFVVQTPDGEREKEDDRPLVGDLKSEDKEFNFFDNTNIHNCKIIDASVPVGKPGAVEEISKLAGKTHEKLKKILHIPELGTEATNLFLPNTKNENLKEKWTTQMTKHSFRCHLNTFYPKALDHGEKWGEFPFKHQCIRRAKMPRFPRKPVFLVLILVLLFCGVSTLLLRSWILRQMIRLRESRRRNIYDRSSRHITKNKK